MTSCLVPTVSVADNDAPAAMARAFRAYQRMKSKPAQVTAVDHDIRDASVRVRQAKLRLLMQKAIIETGAETWRREKEIKRTVDDVKLPATVPQPPPASSSPASSPTSRRLLLDTYDRIKAQPPHEPPSRVDQSALRILVRQTVVTATSPTKPPKLPDDGADEQLTVTLTAPAPLPLSPVPSRRSSLSSSRAGAPPAGQSVCLDVRANGARDSISRQPKDAPVGAPLVGATNTPPSRHAALLVYGRIKGIRADGGSIGSADRVDQSALRTLVQQAVVERALSEVQGARAGVGGGVGPPGNASCTWRVPHMQTHQPHLAIALQVQDAPAGAASIAILVEDGDNVHAD